jgi:hypothetical protein
VIARARHKTLGIIEQLTKAVTIEGVGHDVDVEQPRTG